MKRNELLAAYIEQSRFIANLAQHAISAMKPSDSPLAAVVARQQDTIDKMQATLDRIVTARYDTPVERVVHQVRNDQMPLWGLNDQGDVDAPEESPIKTGIANLHVESDAEFLEVVSVH